MLSLHRAHTQDCPFRSRGWNHTWSCKCPIWADGKLDGRRYKRSLHLTDWDEAQDFVKLGNIQAPPAEPVNEIAAAQAILAVHEYAAQPADQVVYFIGGGLHVKIGIARNVNHRLAELQIANPRCLKIFRVFQGGGALERRLHEILDPFGARGEWFEFNKTVKAIIQRTGTFDVRAGSKMTAAGGGHQ